MTNFPCYQYNKKICWEMLFKMKLSDYCVLFPEKFVNGTKLPNFPLSRDLRKTSTKNKWNVNNFFYVRSYSTTKWHDDYFPQFHSSSNYSTKSKKFALRILNETLEFLFSLHRSSRIFPPKL